MAVIKLKRKHPLGAKKAKSTVEALAKKLKKDLNADYHWEGSRLKFQRSGASGHIDVTEEELDIEIKLGMLLSPLKGKIEKTIHDEIDQRLDA
jgi:putative polyhydroxyalkanoate system protein